MAVKIYGSLDDLPPSYQELFGEAGQRDFFQSRDWFANLIETTFTHGELPRLYALESDKGSPEALLITSTQRSKSTFLTNRSLCGCSNLYSVSFAPLCRSAMPEASKIAEPLVEAIVGDQKWDTIGFDCWDQDSPFFDAFVTALRRHRFLVQTFFHFGNWFENVEAESFDTYFSKRSSSLINTLRRKQRKLEAAGDVQFQVISGPDGLEDGIEAYTQVYKASWKRPEPYPAFTEGLIQAAAGAGVLRLGILWVEGQPVAAQIWIVAGRHATIFKLAHREDQKQLSPGSLLTQYMLRQILEAEDLREIDFGRGDDPFKEFWLSQRRERWGMVAFNPRTVAGLQQAAFEFLGRTGKRFFSRG